MKRVVTTTAALAAAVAVWALMLPPARLVLPAAWDDGSVRGILHVHSRLSDGRGTITDIAAAAARAGLRFVVTTDHGDGTRPPAPPAYHSGVLCIDAVEISTRHGHYVAIGLPQTPYPFGGDARDVVEDVRRLGGFGIAAHPDSPKDELRWSDWPQTPVDGVEIVNPDTSWRVHAFSGQPSSWLQLGRALLTYPARPAETISGLLTPTAAIERQWTSLLASSRVVGVAGADAHAKVALRNAEPGDNRLSLPLPGYEASFASLSVHVVPDTPFSGDAAGDAASLIRGLRAGHAFTAVDGWASPAVFSFTATRAQETWVQGDIIPAGGALTLHVRSNAPAGYTTTVWRDAATIAEARPEPAFDLAIDGAPAVYRAVVHGPAGSAASPWVIGNPIYVRGTAVASAPRSPAFRRAGDGVPLFDGRTVRGWSFESDAASTAVVEAASTAEGPRVRLQYRLSPGGRVGQYAAAAVDLPPGLAGGYEAVAFAVRGERPQRISVQVRGGKPDARPERWERSVYVDGSTRQVVVPFADMRPVGTRAPDRVPTAELRALMFVVDTTNTPPGTGGHLWIGDPALVGLVK